MHVGKLLLIGMTLGFQGLVCCQDSGSFSGINYARNKNATQEPGTMGNYKAALAVDGNTNSDVVDGKSCSHTWGSGALPSSWTVDLGLPLYVTGIIIYNRNAFMDRLRNFKIYGITRSDKEVLYDDNEKNLYNQRVISIDTPATNSFRSIQIWIPARVTNDTMLTLCEVEVYGVPGCEPPTLASHVRMSSSPEKYSVGISINLTCVTGYSSSQNKTITCSENSSWNGVQPTCIPIRCQPPEILQYGYYLVSNKNVCASNDLNNLQYLCEIIAHCNEGYHLENQIKISCQENGQLTISHSKCNIVSCKFPSEVANGKYVNYTISNITFPLETLNYGTKIKVQCETGYKIQGHTERICTSNGTWSGDDPNCSIVQCSIQDLVTIEHGHYLLNVQNKSNTEAAIYMETADLVCERGFMLESKSKFTCTADGTWSRPEASCKIVTCIIPSDTPYIIYRKCYNESFVEFTTELPFGACIEVNCQKGILKSGSRVRNCTEDGSWDGDEAVCERPGNISNTDSHMAVIIGLSCGLVICAVAAIAAVLAFLVYFLRWKRKKRQEENWYTRLHTQQASNVENEYAKIQETTVKLRDGQINISLNGAR